MQAKQIFLVVLVILIAYFLFSFFSTSSEVKQIINYSDFNVNKSINFSSGVSEEYSFYSNNPLVCLIVSKNDLLIQAESFTTQVIKPNSIYLLNPLNLSPSLNEIKLNFSSSNNRTIAFFIPLTDFSSFSELQKQELFDSLTAVYELDSNYFSTIESLKIMQEYADSVSKKKTLSEEKTKEIKISFAENEIGNFFSNIIDSIVTVRQSDDSSSNTNQQNNVSAPVSSSQTLQASTSQTIQPADYINAVSNVALERKGGESATSFESSDFVLTINFKPEAKTFPSKIVIPFSRENEIVIWNGEFEFDGSEVKEFKFEKENDFEENVTFEYTVLDKNEGENAKYIVSFVVDTEKVSGPFKVVKGLIVENGPFPEKHFVEIILIENPCEKRINQFTEFENDYHAEYLKQVELYKASECVLGSVTSLLDLTSKPDQNWIGREEQLSSKILQEFDLNEMGKKSFSDEQKEKRENYFAEFSQGQKNIDTNINPVILEAEKSINFIENYISKIEDVNAVNELNLKLIYARIGLEELNLLVDPTDYGAFRRKVENEIKFFLEKDSNGVSSDVNSLRAMIYADNYLKHGAWDSQSMYLELSNTKYYLEQDLYGALKALAEKMAPYFRSRSWVFPDPSFYSEVFDPYNKNFNKKMNQSFRETILYIGLSKELILEEEAVERLGKHVDSYCDSLRSPGIKFSYKFDSSYDLERIRILELFKEYLGLKLVMGLAYDVNAIQSKISTRKAQGYSLDRTDINYYPKGLEFKVSNNNKTFQEIYLADATTLGEWINGEDYDSKLDYASAQLAREYIQSIYFGTLNSKLRTIEHYKFRGFVENIFDAQELAGNLAVFDNIAQNEYQKIVALKAKEEKLGSWNYFLINLFADPAKLTETQKDINFRLTALSGIKQIQMLLLDGKNIAQIDQRNDNWVQKPAFDSASENETVSRLYSIAKTSGYEYALGMWNYGVTPLEGIIQQEKVSNVPVAMMLPPVRVEMKKFYVSEANKIAKKEEIEKTKTLEEVEELVLPAFYKAKLLLENADYYYSESLYSTAYLIYGDINAFYANTPSAEKANLQMKKFSSWRMIFSKPYWETFGSMSAEFVTVKGIASYLAFGAVAKYLIAPMIVEGAAVRQVQKAYALKAKSVKQVQKVSALNDSINITKALLTVPQLRTPSVILKLKNAGVVIAKYGKRFTNYIWRKLTYDITGTDAVYKKWLQNIAKNAALNEQEIIQLQLETLKKLSVTPLDEMSLIQLTQVQTTLSELKYHNLLSDAQFNILLGTLDDQINFVKTEEVSRAASTGAGPIIDVNPIEPTYTATQTIPLSLAKTSSLSQVSGSVLTFPQVQSLSNLVIAERVAQGNAIGIFNEIKLAYAKSRVETLTQKLNDIQNPKAYVDLSDLKACEDDLSAALKTLEELEKNIGVSELKIACSICSIKINNNGLETDIGKGKSIVIDPQKPLIIGDATIDGEKVIVRVKQTIVPEAKLATATTAKLSSGKISLQIVTPKAIDVTKAPSATIEIIQDAPTINTGIQNLPTIGEINAILVREKGITLNSLIETDSYQITFDGEKIKIPSNSALWVEREKKIGELSFFEGRDSLLLRNDSSNVLTVDGKVVPKGQIVDTGFGAGEFSFYAEFDGKPIYIYRGKLSSNEIDWENDFLNQLLNDPLERTFLVTDQKKWDLLNSSSACGAAACYSKSVRAIFLGPTTNLSNLISGTPKFENYFENLMHERMHRALNFIPPAKRLEIETRFLNNSDFELLKRRFVELYPTYANRSDLIIIDEFLSFGFTDGAKYSGGEIVFGPSARFTPEELKQFYDRILKIIPKQELQQIFDEGNAIFGSLGTGISNGSNPIQLSSTNPISLDICTSGCSVTTQAKTIVVNPTQEALVAQTSQGVAVSDMGRVAKIIITPKSGFSSASIVNNALNFTCPSQCIFDNGTPVKIFDNISQLDISSSPFKEISATRIVEYSPSEVVKNGMSAIGVSPNVPQYIGQVETALREGKTVAVIHNVSGRQEIVVYTNNNSAQDVRDALVPSSSTLIVPILSEPLDDLVSGQIFIGLVDDSPLSTQGLPKINLSKEESFGACCSIAIADSLDVFHSNNNSVFANYPKFDSAKSWLLTGTDNDARRMRTIIEMWDKGIEYVLTYRVENGRFVTNPTSSAVDSFLSNVINGAINQQTIENTILRNLENTTLDPAAMQRYKNSLSTFFGFMQGVAKPAPVSAPIASGFSALALNSSGVITSKAQLAIDYGYTIIYKNGPYKVFVNPGVSRYLNAPRNNNWEEYSYHIGFFDPESEALFVTNTITERDSIRYRVEFNWGLEMVKYYDDFGIRLARLVDNYNANNSTKTLNEINYYLQLLAKNKVLDTTSSKIGKAFSQGDPNWPSLLAQVDSVSSSVQTAKTQAFRTYAESMAKPGEYVCGTHHSHPQTRLSDLNPSFPDACHYSYETQSILAKATTPGFFERLIAVFTGEKTIPYAPFSYNTISGDDGHIPLLVGERTCVGIQEAWRIREKVEHAAYPDNAPRIRAEVYAGR